MLSWAQIRLGYGTFMELSTSKNRELEAKMEVSTMELYYVAEQERKRRTQYKHCQIPPKQLTSDKNHGIIAIVYRNPCRDNIYENEVRYEKKDDSYSFVGDGGSNVV